MLFDTSKRERARKLGHPKHLAPSSNATTSEEAIINDRSTQNHSDSTPSPLHSGATSYQVRINPQKGLKLGWKRKFTNFTFIKRKHKKWFYLSFLLYITKVTFFTSLYSQKLWENIIQQYRNLHKCEQSISRSSNFEISSSHAPLRIEVNLGFSSKVII